MKFSLEFKCSAGHKRRVAVVHYFQFRQQFLNVSGRDKLIFSSFAGYQPNGIERKNTQNTHNKDGNRRRYFQKGKPTLKPLFL